MCGRGRRRRCRRWCRRDGTYDDQHILILVNLRRFVIFGHFVDIRSSHSNTHINSSNRFKITIKSYSCRVDRYLQHISELDPNLLYL